MKSCVCVWMWFPAAATSFVITSRLCLRPLTSIRSSWENQQEYPDESQGYQQYSNDDQANQQYFEGDQGYEQYIEQYSSANQGAFQQENYPAQQTQQGYEQYPSHDQGYQQYQSQDPVSDGSQYQGHENLGYQQEQYTQQEQYGISQSGGQDENYQQQADESQGLILDGLDREMSKVASNLSFTESDYLAAARRRAEMRVASANAGATEEEWLQVANEKKQQFGVIDDWENSAKEAGNTDSHILMFTEPPPDGEDDNEPKLLLF